MDDWAAAAASIAAAFADPELVTPVLEGEGYVRPFAAVRRDEAAQATAGRGNTLRVVSFEISYGDLPRKPTKRDAFEHRGTRWAVEEATPRDDIGAWIVAVVDAGALPYAPRRKP